MKYSSPSTRYHCLRPIGPVNASDSMMKSETHLYCSKVNLSKDRKPHVYHLVNLRAETLHVILVFICISNHRVY